MDLSTRNTHKPAFIIQDTYSALILIRIRNQYPSLDPFTSRPIIPSLFFFYAGYALTH